MKKAAVSTREKMIRIAAEIFAEHGYKETTVRMIADKAKVNVAAINYHFGDKRNLYLAVVNYWRDDAFKEFPLSKITDEGVAPEERLKLFIRHTLICLLGEDGKGTGFGRLITWEASFSPSTVVGEMISKSIGEPTKALFEVISKITGESDMKKVKIQGACIVGQTVYFYLSRFLIEELYNIEPFNTKEDIEKVADAIFDFSIGALQN